MKKKVIWKTLSQYREGVASGKIEVIVVCNGCSDKTAEVVTSFGLGFECIDTPIASKTNALNLGDALAKGFPRIYQDADVVVSLKAIREIAIVLKSGQFKAAAPKMKMDLKQSSWPVRYYYEVWQKLPYVQEGMIGAGVYGLSEAGRKHFVKFPQVIADDGYIRALFKSKERALVESCFSQVTAPTTLDGLIKIKTRSRLGRYELKEKYPELSVNEEKRYGNAILTMIRQIHFWPKILVYFYVNLIARSRATMQSSRNGYIGWERDDSSRGLKES
jgi:glycosyltransferase involved in cell wall biosynthesis